jgi:hypothetical protein
MPFNQPRTNNGTHQCGASSGDRSNDTDTRLNSSSFMTPRRTTATRTQLTAAALEAKKEKLLKVINDVLDLIMDDWDDVF